MTLAAKIVPTLGVTSSTNRTEFSCYAPKVDRVEVRVFKGNENLIFPLKPVRDGYWATSVEKKFTDYRYLFRVWTPELKELVDPYAFQLETPTGPGLITDLKPMSDDGFKAPKSSDWVISEAHVRDLVGCCTNIPKNQSIFAQLKTFFSQPNPIEDLGVNAVEFMPLTEFDASSPNTYAWGYMPAHYFALSSTYGTPREFQSLVQTLHARGLAVILDVVYNHTGEMNDLLRWDENYVRHNADGTRTNCSGCGNDLRTEHPFVQRLIVDSLIHFLKFYRVDGFRFDLAELLNVDVLRKVETALRAYKSDVILIAEPWSFRGYIPHQLRETTWSCWNDRCRECVYAYVEGNGRASDLTYVMNGCVPDPFVNAQQSINYTESHDDCAWADRLSGNAETVRRKTHIMFAILTCSAGIPMIAEGQDSLRSKHHVRNTYNRGGLNLLDWEVLKKHEATHLYVKNLLKLRISDIGKLIKSEQTTQTYKHLFHGDMGSAVGILFNADGSLGTQRVLFFVNPHLFEVNFDLNNLDTQNFHQIADTDRFFADKTRRLPKAFLLKPFSCALFIKEM